MVQLSLGDVIASTLRSRSRVWTNCRQILFHGRAVSTIWPLLNQQNVKQCLEGLDVCIYVVNALVYATLRKQRCCMVFKRSLQLQMIIGTASHHCRYMHCHLQPLPRPDDMYTLHVS